MAQTIASTQTMDAAVKMRSSRTRVSSFQVQTITTCTHSTQNTDTAVRGHRRYACPGSCSARYANCPGNDMVWNRTRSPNSRTRKSRSGPTARCAICMDRQSLASYRKSIDSTRRVQMWPRWVTWAGTGCCRIAIPPTWRATPAGGVDVHIGVPRESRPGETRVAATPATVAQLIDLGHSVVVETGAGVAASARDEDYAAAGAQLGSAAEAWGADVVVHVDKPTPEEIAALRDGAVLISSLTPALDPDLVERLAARPVTALAVDAVPRISRAQSLDVLSSMANIAGYRAVVEAAHAFGRFFTGQVTAAGKVPPAKVLVAGAGVAGLAAIGAASSLGAIVRATDVRPEVAEQIASLGGEYVAVPAAEAQVSADGYAREMSEDYHRRAAQMDAEQTRDVGIEIPTALIRGRPAPRLITEEMVAGMRPGSVIVDMAAGQGGTVAGSVPDQVVVTPNGVTIIGYTDLPGRLPGQASQLFGTNVVNLVTLLTPAADGQLVLDLDDVVQRAITVVRDGQVLGPPTPVPASAAPVAAPTPEPAAPARPAQEPVPTSRRFALVGVAAAALFL